MSDQKIIINGMPYTIFFLGVCATNAKSILTNSF